jgi:hypothetical protein
MGKGSRSTSTAKGAFELDEDAPVVVFDETKLGIQRRNTVQRRQVQVGDATTISTDADE